MFLSIYLSIYILISCLIGPQSKLVCMLQLWVAFIANFTMFSVGHCFSMSGYLIPKLQDEEFGLGINFEEASWFGN